MLDNKYLDGTSETVIRCYGLLDAAIAGGVKDFTDGMYFGDKFLSYSIAQSNQAEYLLDQVSCKTGSHILDVGCGNGRILLAAKKRGAEAIGVTISSEQVERCKKDGLTAYLMNYKNIPDEWNGTFDGIIANGCIEHFVQVQDVIDGKQDQIYKEMFKIFHRLLKKGGYLATTVSHFNYFVDPKEIIKGSNRHKYGSSNFHFSRFLLEDFGGWYPRGNQLEIDSQNFFEIKNREDGTEDYHWTYEYWLKEMKRKILISPKVWLTLLKKIFKTQKATISMLKDLLISQSAMWQFRKNKDGITPILLFRDTWKRVD
ncbi:MAG: class I SAM-dependent methyltransferase [Candidatus Paceibacterota bacterium]|jgi:cyclopropane-fatty-acyl-phospholipid synthase